jgi:hypothetical protein
LPARPPSRPQPYTFCILPAAGAPGAGHFVPAPNARAENEVDAHCGMFEARTNDGYYQLGLDTVAVVRVHGAARVACADGAIDPRGRHVDARVVRSGRRDGRVFGCSRGLAGVTSRTLVGASASD